MSSSQLTLQVNAYHAWKQSLIKEIERYLNWLQSQQLLTEDLASKLQRSLALLREDELSIAFVGEFSRGKTELINALFFADFGLRMLPSQAGRTTMCPTELFYDQDSGSEYIRLLPIDTRATEKTLASFKQEPGTWVQHNLDTNDPAAMQAMLAEVARTRSVPPEQAQALGFREDMLDPDPDNPRQVLIPAWRHALISLRHPLLERGLRILDTPGLNALGSEPELTLSMIPGAQAVIFLLGVDTGVTASDLTIWKDHVAAEDNDHRAGRFAVLNKIDMLWDDLQDEGHTQKSIQEVQRKSAELLGLRPDEVLLVSAKQALLGKVRNEPERLVRSRITDLERLLSERILAQKEKLLGRALLDDILELLQGSQQILEDRLKTLNGRLAELNGSSPSKDVLRELTERTQDEHLYYNKKLITLRSSRRLMKSQARIFEKLTEPARFETQLQRTHDQLMSSWTTLGMFRAMNDFFDALEDGLSHLMHEARLAQKMVGSIYERYGTDARASHLKPPTFRLDRHQRALQDLRQQATRLQRNPKSLITEQTLLVKRFFNTLAAEARKLHDAMREDCERWPEEALLPILQHTLEQKQMLEQQIQRLRELAKQAKTSQEQARRLQQLIEETEKQLYLAEQIQRRLRRPVPAAARPQSQARQNLPLS